MSQAYQVIGTRPVRHDGMDKVTGRALYGADFNTAGLLHGRILRSPHAHAKIKKIDVSRALALPGVEAVVTSTDFPDPADRVANLGEGAVKLRDLANICMAHGKVVFRGQPVAAVAAVNGHIAEEACKLIQVEYEVLPSVTDVVKAMQPEAPILHDDLVTESMAGAETSDAAPT